MYDLIPLIIILISFIILIVIVVRKFPALASLDVSSIQNEKEVQFKEQIIGTRLKRNVIKWWSKANKIWRPLIGLISHLFHWLYNGLINLKEKYKSEQVISAEDIQETVNRLFDEFEDLKKKDEKIEAEKKLIEIIGLDCKNLKAFKALGMLYLDRKNIEEAKQTFGHILRLLDNEEEEIERGDLRHRDEQLFRKQLLNIANERGIAFDNLSYSYELEGDYDKSGEYINKSLDIDPKNPRRLDTLLSICIMKKDKDSAKKAYERLAEVNPENQKLAELKVKIDEL